MHNWKISEYDCCFCTGNTFCSSDIFFIKGINFVLVTFAAAFGYTSRGPFKYFDPDSSPNILKFIKAAVSVQFILYYTFMLPFLF